MLRSKHELNLEKEDLYQITPKCLIYVHKTLKFLWRWPPKSAAWHQQNHDPCSGDNGALLDLQQVSLFRGIFSNWAFHWFYSPFPLLTGMARPRASSVPWHASQMPVTWPPGSGQVWSVPTLSAPLYHLPNVTCPSAWTELPWRELSVPYCRALVTLLPSGLLFS